MGWSGGRAGRGRRREGGGDASQQAGAGAPLPRRGRARIADAGRWPSVCHASLPARACPSWGWKRWEGLGCLGVPGGAVVKDSLADAGDVGSTPELGRSLGGGNGNPLQCSCLEHPADLGAWWTTVHGVAKESDTTETPHDRVLEKAACRVLG